MSEKITIPEPRDDRQLNDWVRYIVNNNDVEDSYALISDAIAELQGAKRAIYELADEETQEEIDSYDMEAEIMADQQETYRRVYLADGYLEACIEAKKREE